MIKKIFASTTALTLAVSTVAYAASPTVFPHGISASASIVNGAGVSQGTVGEAATAAAGAVQANGGDASKTVVTPTGDTASHALSDVAARAMGSVQKTSIGAANGVAPTDANAMMSAPVSGDTSASPATAKNASIGRPIAEHFGDYLDVRDFGALLDGKADDTAALQVVKDAAVNGQAIMVPPVSGSNNTLNLNAYPTSTPDKINFWWLYGKTAPGGYPLFTFGYDPVFSTIGQGFWFHRDKSVPNSGPLVRIDANFTDADGADGATVNGQNETCQIPSINMKNYVWCNQITMASSGYGSAQHVADAVNANKPADALSDGNGPRSEIWGRYTEVDDKTGETSEKSGGIVGHEMDLSVNNKDTKGWRIHLQMSLNKFSSSGYAPNGAAFIDLGADPGNYINRGITMHSDYRMAGFDVSRSKSFSYSASVTSDVSKGSVVIPVQTTHDGIWVGMFVSGVGIASGSQVEAITDNTMTLTLPTTSDIKAAQLLGVSANAPAFKMAADQFISFNGIGQDANNDNDPGMADIRGDAFLGYNSGTSSLQYSKSGITTFSLGRYGNVSVSLNTGKDALGTLSAYSAYGAGAAAFNSTNFNGDALYMKGGQNIIWEATSTAKTAWSLLDGALEDTYAGKMIRSVDARGNEVLQGTVKPLNGVLLPSMTTAQIKAIVNPPNALEVYDTDTKTPVILVDGVWHQISLGASL